MRSNLNYDQNLLEQAKKLGGFKYKTEAVNAALDEFVKRRRQEKVLELFGKIEYDEDYDHKQARKRKA
ncbi:MAG: type II toxin-antitoxin system VapB family antitoxin [Chlamydiia bacterium]|nr:type II toxin-antitoxin system VapB family antitoxin [Chlamydiia bacterium]